MSGQLYNYRAKVERIIDGDTIVALIDVGLKVYVESTLRLFGINAPEMKLESRPKGIAAKHHLEVLIPPGTSVLLKTVKDKREKFGRWLAVIEVEQLDGTRTNINDEMTKSGHAAVNFYDGKGDQ